MLCSVKGYQNYGGRGITVCDEWLHSFVSFKDWAFEHGYQEGLTIDRINNDGNYEPDNCRWVDYITQANNKRGCLYATIDGETKTLTEWCRVLNISYSTIMSRRQKNKDIPIETLLLTPIYRGLSMEEKLKNINANKEGVA